MNPRAASPRPAGAVGRIRITIRCFSHVRNALGAETLDISLPAGATAAEVEAHVRALAPEKLAALPWRIAVNREFARPDVPLADGDEVALIPPVQGG